MSNPEELPVEDNEVDSTQISDLEILNDPDFAKEIDRFSDRDEVSVIIYETPGGTVGRIDFQPYNNLDFNPEIMTMALTQGIRGLKSFLDNSGEGKTYPGVEYLIGESSPTMTSAAQRVGFQTTPEGLLVGDPDKLRAGIAKIEQSGLLDRLAQREKKETDRYHDRHFKES